MPREDLRAALERALAATDADERLGPRVGAAGLRARFEFTDCDLVLNVAAGDGEHNLSWWFGDDPAWRPRLRLEMDSGTANRYLQGRESLAIAIARGRVRVRGESRAALAFLPAARLISGHYRRVVDSDFPALAQGV
ncbi:MAG: hypothetical protein GEU88_05885 [Solirubrobacterales bacterium]|nr:hypothetical protein [Solirubrobacterales bacterium]